MEISQLQINIISSNIFIEDIKSYINKHPKEYEEFLKNENKKVYPQ